MNNVGLVVSFICKTRSAQSLGYILISIVLNPMERHNSFSWNTSLSLRAIWNNLVKYFQYLSLVKRCHPLLTVGAIAVSNRRPQFVTDATHFAWIGLFLPMDVPTFWINRSSLNKHSSPLKDNSKNSMTESYENCFEFSTLQYPFTQILPESNYVPDHLQSLDAIYISIHTLNSNYMTIQLSGKVKAVYNWFKKLI